MPRSPYKTRKSPRRQVAGCQIGIKDAIADLAIDLRGMKSSWRCHSKGCQSDLRNARKNLARARRRMRDGKCKQALTALRSAWMYYDYTWCKEKH